MKRSPKVAGIGKECVACGCCVKVCPLQAIEIVRGVMAQVRQDKCVGCGLCTMKCPRKCLVKINPVTGTPEAPAKPEPTGCACCAMADQCPSAQAQKQK